MPERQELEALFLSHLSAVEKILGGIARRHGLARDAAEEFGAWAKLRLIEDNYAILAKFRGESSLPTYLTVVLAMLFREYRVAQWGRWRPSAAARREGELAMRLEMLVRRDRLPLAQAAETLRSSGETTLSDRQLAALLSGLPERAPLRPVEVGTQIGDPPAPARADDLLYEADTAAERDAAHAALRRVLDELPADDRLLVRMRYLEDMSVADIARGLALPQKPLYRRIEHALDALRVGLERAGISRERMRAVVGDPPW
jgi:RNA polymerase sigma factor for flagellar operon FliA